MASRGLASIGCFLRGPSTPLQAGTHTEEVVSLLDVDLKVGLSTKEVRRRQKEYGPNRVTARRGAPAWLKFLQQFNQPLVYILLLAVGVTAFLGEWVDSSVILGVDTLRSASEETVAKRVWSADAIFPAAPNGRSLFSAAAANRRPTGAR
jgi:hypothetical protein